MNIVMDHPDSAIWLQSIAGKDICLQTCRQTTQVRSPNELDNMFKYASDEWASECWSSPSQS